MTTLKDLEDFVRAMSADGKSLGDFAPLFERLHLMQSDNLRLRGALWDILEQWDLDEAGEIARAALSGQEDT